MVLTPVAQGKNSASNRDYNDQIQRRKNHEMHCWDDSKDNNAVKGDLFGYVENCISIRPNTKSLGMIELFTILNVYDKTYRLPQWSENVGQGYRNVVELSNDPVFVGSFKDFKEYGAFIGDTKEALDMRRYGPSFNKFKEALDLVNLGGCISVGNQSAFSSTFNKLKNDI